MTKKIFIAIIATFIIEYQSIYSQITNKKEILLGIDLIGPATKFFEKDKNALEMSFQLALINKINFSIEGGILKFNKNYSDTLKSYDYSENGSFYRAGADYKFFQNQIQNKINYIFIGTRLAQSQLKHSGSNIRIADNTWGQRITEFPETTYQIRWIEMLGGIRVSLTKYVALGWALRFKFIIQKENQDKVVPYYIPGYGKGGNNKTLDFSYTLYFTIPINR